MKPRFVTTLPMILLAVMVILGGLVTSAGRTLRKTRTHLWRCCQQCRPPSITAMNQGMQDEAAIYGVELVILDPAFDPQKQVSMIDNLIAQGVARCW